MSQVENINEEKKEEIVNPEIGLFSSDDANLSIQHLYGEIIWLKVYEYPYWPAMVLNPSWLPPPLANKLKLTKKKTQTRIVAQFFDDVSSCQIVGLKNICHPFDDFYADYKTSKNLNPMFVKKAKKMNEMTRLQRCQLHSPNMVEDDLVKNDHCAVCNKLIEDLDPIDLRISRGICVSPLTESNFGSKSYYRCCNPTCLSLYHKACVPNCSLHGRCGRCRVEVKEEKETTINQGDDRMSMTKSSLKRVNMESDDDSKLHHHESDDDDSKHSMIKRHPSRSTRAPTYHEDEDEDHVETRFSRGAKKRRVLPPRMKHPSVGSLSSVGSSLESTIFEKIENDAVDGVVNSVMICVWRKDADADADADVSSLVKQKSKSIVAWFSSFQPIQQRYILHLMMLLSHSRNEMIKIFADGAILLLKKKFIRHHEEENYDDFVRNVSYYTSGLDGVRGNNYSRLVDIFEKPELCLLCRLIENTILNIYSEMNESYDNCIDDVVMLLRDNEEIRNQVISGDMNISELMSIPKVMLSE